MANQPPALHPDRTYIAISSNLDPHALASSLNKQDLPEPIRLQYRGPVGELDGEHIFEVESKDGALAPDSREWAAQKDPLVAGVKKADGVSGVQPLVAKQRAKREEL